MGGTFYIAMLIIEVCNNSTIEQNTLSDIHESVKVNNQAVWAVTDYSTCPSFACIVWCMYFLWCESLFNKF